MDLSELVVGRVLEIPLELFETLILGQIQMIQNEGDRDSTQRTLLRNAVFLARECTDLRKRVKELEKQVDNAPDDSRGWRPLAFRKVKIPEPGR